MTSTHGVSEGNDQIRVFMRIRPMNDLERNSQSTRCVSIDSDSTKIVLRDDESRGESFQFDKIFDEGADQSEIYEIVAIPLLNKFLLGENCCLFTFGEIASGKTFTLFGSTEENMLNEKNTDDISSLSSCGVSEARIRPHHLLNVSMNPSPLLNLPDSLGGDVGPQQITPLQRMMQMKMNTLKIHQQQIIEKGKVRKEKELPEVSDTYKAMPHRRKSKGIVIDFDNAMMPKEEYTAVPGLVKFLLRGFFNAIFDLYGTIDTIVRFSMYDIYMDEIRDLLGPIDLKMENDLKIKRMEHGVFVDGVNQIGCTTELEVMDLIERGVENRKYCLSKNYGHGFFPRSHSVLELMVERNDKQSGKKSINTFRLLDLAGYEDLSTMNAVHQSEDLIRKANLNLVFLEKVVKDLCDSNETASFHESKLTQILQDRLLCSCATSLVITASPSSLSFNNTVSSARFGQAVRRLAKVSRSKYTATSGLVDRATRSMHLNQPRRKMMLQQLSSRRRLQREPSMKSITEVDDESASRNSSRTSGAGSSNLSSIDSSINNNSATKRNNSVDSMSRKSDVSSNNSVNLRTSMNQMQETVSSASHGLLTIAEKLSTQSKQMNTDLSIAKLLVNTDQSVEIKTILSPDEVDANIEEIKAILPHISKPLYTASKRISFKETTRSNTIDKPRPTSNDGAMDGDHIDDKHNSHLQISMNSEPVNSRKSFSNKRYGNECPQAKESSVNGTNYPPMNIPSEVRTEQANGNHMHYNKSNDVFIQDDSTKSELFVKIKEQEYRIRELHAEISLLQQTNADLTIKIENTSEELTQVKEEVTHLTLRAKEAEDAYQDLMQKREGMKMERYEEKVKLSLGDNQNKLNGKENDGDGDVFDENVDLSKKSQRSVGNNSFPVQVYLRLKPASRHEMNQQVGNWMDIDERDESILVNSTLDGERKYKFTFDKVFPIDVTSSTVNIFVGPSVVSNLLSGINCCVMVYGLQKSGKTFTLFGENFGNTSRQESSSSGSGQHDSVKSSLTDNDPDYDGLFPSIVQGIFSQIRYSSQSNVEYTIRCSFVALYLETFYDLLESQTTKNIYVHNDDENQSNNIHGACRVFCFHESDVMGIIRRGLSCYSALSKRSKIDASLSHTIFVMEIHQKDLTTDLQKVGRLQMVEIAGFVNSIETTNMSPHSIFETKLNYKSFSALKNVVECLNNNDSRAINDLYKESKLTRVLKDALGGNCITSLIVTSSSTSINISDTNSLLNFSQKVRLITTRPRVNREYGIDRYKKWLMVSEIKLGELSEFVMELARELIGKKELNDIVSSDLYKTIISIVREEVTIWNPCRRSYSLGNAHEIQNSGLKWKSLSKDLLLTLEGMNQTQSMNLTQDSKSDEIDSRLSDMQSEVAVLRRNNEILLEECRMTKEELSDCKKRIQLNSVEIIDLNHRVRNTEIRLEQAKIIIFQLRKICHQLRFDCIDRRSKDLNEILKMFQEEKIDWSGLMDMDVLLLQEGFITREDINEKEECDEIDFSVASNSIDNSNLKAKPRASSLFPKIEKRISSEKGKIKKAVTSVLPPPLTNVDSGNQQKNNLYAWFQALNIRSNNSVSSDPTGVDLPYSPTSTEVEMTKKLRKLSRKCIELQDKLTQEKMHVSALIDNSGNQKETAQNLVESRQVQKNLEEDLRTILLKLDESHKVNSIINHKLNGMNQNNLLMEDAFNRLQGSYKELVMESNEHEVNLKSKVAYLEQVIDSLTSPNQSSTQISKEVVFELPRINVPLRGGSKDPRSTDDGAETVESSIVSNVDVETFVSTSVVSVASSLKSQEKTISSKVKRKSKYGRKSKNDCHTQIKKHQHRRMTKKQSNLKIAKKKDSHKLSFAKFGTINGSSSIIESKIAE